MRISMAPRNSAAVCNVFTEQNLAAWPRVLLSPCQSTQFKTEAPDGQRDQRDKSSETCATGFAPFFHRRFSRCCCDGRCAQRLCAWSVHARHGGESGSDVSGSPEGSGALRPLSSFLFPQYV